MTHIFQYMIHLWKERTWDRRKFIHCCMLRLQVPDKRWSIQMTPVHSLIFRRPANQEHAFFAAGHLDRQVVCYWLDMGIFPLFPGLFRTRFVFIPALGIPIRANARCVAIANNNNIWKGPCCHFIWFVFKLREMNLVHWYFVVGQNLFPFLGGGGGGVERKKRRGRVCDIHSSPLHVSSFETFVQKKYFF